MATTCFGSGASWEVLWCRPRSAIVCVSLGLPGGDCKMICSWLPPVLDLGVLGRGYPVNLGWLPPVADLRTFGGHHSVSCGQPPLVSGLWLLNWCYIPSQYWLQLIPDLGPPDESYYTSCDGLLLLLGLRTLSMRCRACWGQLWLICCFWTFGRF